MSSQEPQRPYAEGAVDGDEVGCLVSTVPVLPPLVLLKVGLGVFAVEGCEVGCFVGALEGAGEGAVVGAAVGELVGSLVNGAAVGALEGAGEGDD